MTEPLIEIHPAVWYEASEAAHLLKVSTRTLARSGIPNARLNRRRALYLGRDVLAWLETRKQRGQIRRMG